MTSLPEVRPSPYLLLPVTPGPELDGRSGTNCARTPTSQRYAMGVMGGLFTYLVNAGYLAGNPWTLRRRKRLPRVRQVERYLDSGSRRDRCLSLSLRVL